ncbi:dTDP-4-dehydrorhamnose reductase family protein [Bradyrhizobium sp. AZCC 2289]|uniref:dTDP-4-dehydrorhamnose reductase family protein n=1 Tax=Bradyrhizobium sp. AZCC 2289 TaxID=3117026 RepID=UPI002FF2BC8D
MTNNNDEKVLVLGATGMLGHTTLRYFVNRNQYPVVGSVRSEAGLRLLPTELRQNIAVGVDVSDSDSLMQLFVDVRPQIVINCIGLVKQLAQADDPLVALPINSLLPHRLARLCAVSNARLIHISTDCIFSGSKGMYREDDPSDARDLYGRSKFLGEVDYPHAVTLRTSIVGPELNSSHGLVGWFLSQRTRVLGYTKAIFSGLTTVELAHVMHDFVIPHPNIRGVYHVSVDAIDKYALLRHVAETYGTTTAITPDDKLVIDRSLDSTRFKSATGYKPPAWPELITRMRDFG